MKIFSVFFFIAFLFSTLLFSEILNYEEANIKLDIPENWLYQYDGDSLILNKDDTKIVITNNNVGNIEINNITYMRFLNKIITELSTSYGDIDITKGPKEINLCSMDGIETDMENSGDIIFRSIIFSSDPSKIITITVSCYKSKYTMYEDDISGIITSIERSQFLSLNENDRYYDSYGFYSIIFPEHWEVLGYDSIFSSNNNTLMCRRSNSSPARGTYTKFHINAALKTTGESTDINSTFYQFKNTFESIGFSNFQILDNGTIMINDMFVEYLNFTMEIKFKDLLLRGKFYTIVDNDISYIFFAMSSDDIADVFFGECEEILETFKVEYDSIALYSSVEDYILDENSRYYNNEGLYSIIFPENWSIFDVDELKNTVTAVSSMNNIYDTIQENVIISYNILDEKMTLDEYYDHYVNLLHNNYRGFQKHEEDFLNINNIDYKWFVYTFDSGSENKTKHLAYMTLNGDYYYLATFCTLIDQFQTKRDEFENIIQTFNFEDISISSYEYILREENRYFDDAGKYSIIFPDNWEVDVFGMVINAKDAVQSLSGEFTANVTILSREVQLPYNLDEKFSKDIEELLKVTNVENYISGDTIIETCEAKWILYTSHLLELRNQVYTVSLLKNNRKYTITFQDSYENFLESFELFKEILKTFRVE